MYAKKLKTLNIILIFIEKPYKESREKISVDSYNYTTTTFVPSFV